VEQGPTSKEELDAAIKGEKKGKAAGTDGIPAEAWHALDQSRGAVLRLFNCCWATAALPKAWREALVVGVVETGAAMDPAQPQTDPHKVRGGIPAARLEEGLQARLRQTQRWLQPVLPDSRQRRTNALPQEVRLHQFSHGRGPAPWPRGRTESPRRRGTRWTSLGVRCSASSTAVGPRRHCRRHGGRHWWWGLSRKVLRWTPPSHRPISLLLTAHKVRGGIPAARLQEGLKDRLRQAQNRFQHVSRDSQQRRTSAFAT